MAKLSGTVVMSLVYDHEVRDQDSYQEGTLRTA